MNGVKVRVYGKENCSLCDAAKDKLHKMGIHFETHNLQYHVDYHDGWRGDRSRQVTAAHSHIDKLPLIEINGDYYDYPGAMKVLKRIKKAGRKAHGSNQSRSKDSKNKG